MKTRPVEKKKNRKIKFCNVGPERVSRSRRFDVSLFYRIFSKQCKILQCGLTADCACLSQIKVCSLCFTSLFKVFRSLIEYLVSGDMKKG